MHLNIHDTLDIPINQILFFWPTLTLETSLIEPHAEDDSVALSEIAQGMAGPPS